MREPRRDSLAIVPALNEAGSIEAVVKRAREALNVDVLVVDDGSTDDTAELARKAGATVISHPYNLGVGAAIRTAMMYACRAGYTCVLQIDGDGQHEPTEGAKLLERLRRGDVDIVIGSRFEAGYQTSGGRRLLMRLLSRVISRRVGVAITDTTSGFRAFSEDAVRYFTRVYPTDYLSDTVEALLLAGDAGLRVEELAVQMHPRVTGKPSAGTVRSGYYFVRLLLVIAMHRFRRT